MNYIKIYKENKSKKDKKFLSETCKYFTDFFIIDEIVREFLEDRIPDTTRVTKSLKKLCLIDENTVFLPFEEITDILNFSIFTEREQIKNKIQNEKFGGISKLTNVMINGVNEESYENSQEVYKVDEIKKFIVEKSNKITEDVSEKNQDIIVSFI